MSSTSSIEWTTSTWNPVTGCTKVSPGCDHCYAEAFAERFRGVPGHPYEQGFDLTLHPDRLTLPLRWRKPRRIFVNSMSDLFHADVPSEYIAEVFAVMALSEQHTFQVLTKRAERMERLVGRDTFIDEVDSARLRRLPLSIMPDWPRPNVWLGVSVESPTYYSRIRHLSRTPAAVRFLSCEPLLSPLPDLPLDGISWVIVGGESGPGARPMHPEWVRDIRDQCQRAGVPFFFKQWGAWEPVAPVYSDDMPEHVEVEDGVEVDHTEDDHDQAVWDVVDREVMERRDIPAVYPDGYVSYEQIQPPPGSWWMDRVGKKRAGRELDGRTWDEMPESAADKEKTRVP